MPIPEGAGPGPNHIYGASKDDDGEGGSDYRLGGEGRGGRQGGSGGSGGSGGGNKASPRAARAPPRAPPAGGGKGRAKRGGVFPLPSPSGADDPSITPPWTPTGGGDAGSPHGSPTFHDETRWKVSRWHPTHTELDVATDGLWPLVVFFEAILFTIERCMKPHRLT